MDCSEAQELLYLSFEGQITPSQQVALNAHRRTCFACSTKLQQSEKFQALLRKVPQVTVPRGLEERILAHVAAHGGVLTTPRPKNVFAFPKIAFPRLQLTPGGVLAMGGVLAAAVAIFFIANNLISTTLTPGGSAVSAMVQGSLQTASGGVLSGQIPIRSGETVRNVGKASVVVAFSPNMLLRVDPATQLHFAKVYTDRYTGQIYISDMHIDRGTVAVREHLHRDASPIHVATTLATFVPTGTIFTVTQTKGLTHLSVSQGRVAVYLTRKMFEVRAGRGVKLVANGGVLWDKVAKKRKP